MASDRTLRTLVLTAIIVAICLPALGNRTTVDPNAPAVTAASTVTNERSADPRLSPKVTYVSGYKRLSAVVDEISKTSGLVVRAGRNTDDWRVRDIPLVVCAQDVPLGRLLTAIADATHLGFGAEKTGDKTDRAYRIYRDGPRARQLAAFLDSRVAKKMAEEEQGWDLMSELKNVSAEQFVKETGLGDASALDYFRVVASLGPEVKGNVFAGQPVVIGYKSLPSAARAPFEGVARWLYRSARETDERFRKEHPGYSGSPVEDFGTGDLERCTLEIEPSFGGDGDVWGVLINIKTPVHEHRLAAHDALWLGRMLTGIKVPKAKAEEECLPPGFQRLPRGEGKWECAPGLEKEVKIEKWTAAEDPKPADFMQQFSSASGLCIIYEDFFSHEQCNRDAIRGLFGSTSKGIDLLNGFMRVAGHKSSTPDWLYSEKDGVLIGWDHAWQIRHTNLVRASYLGRLRALLNGDGMPLDDYLTVMLLTDGERWDWVLGDPDLARLGGAGNRGPIWTLYAQLKADDRALAQTDAGVPFARLGVDAANLISEQNSRIAEFSDPEGSAPKLIATDIDPRTLSMRLRQEPPATNGHSAYSIELLTSDQQVLHKIILDETFPIYSKKREAQLAERRH